MYTVRAARLADAPALGQVHCASWRAAYQGILPDDVLRRLNVEERSQRMRRVIEETNACRCLLVAADANDLPVGFCSAGPECTEHPLYRGEIYGLYLDPHVQRQGLGRRLVAAARQRLRAAGMHGLLIWVLRENRSACAFYASLGGRAALVETLPLAGGAHACLGYVWDEPEAADPSAAGR